MKSKHTDKQLDWLRSHLAEYESRAAGNVRGDAKKFALEMADNYIEKWGVADGDKESTMKEQIYTWFKNTSARGKEARKRHQLMKRGAERPASTSAYLTVPNIEQAHAHASTSAAPQIRYAPPPPQPPQPQQQQQQPAQGPGPANLYVPPPIVQQQGPQPQVPPPAPGPVPPPHYGPPPPQPQQPQQPQQPPPQPQHAQNVLTLRDALLDTSCSANDVCGAMQNCAIIPDIIAALFAAAMMLTNTTAAAELGLADPVCHLLHRYSSAISLWTARMACKSYSGPMAGRHILQHAIRMNSQWVPSSPSPVPLLPQHQHHHMEEEYARLNMDRQRRRDHILWARIHAAALEMGLMEHSWLAERLANDLMWEADEAEWVCGCVLLRGLMRSNKGPTDSLTMTWTEMTHRYQEKWKEVRDESRQTLMAETLLETRKLLEHNRM